MINAVGRDIPEEILEMTGKEVFQGNHYRDGYVYKKDGPYTKCVVNNTQSKLCLLYTSEIRPSESCTTGSFIIRKNYRKISWKKAGNFPPPVIQK